jgi:hypothetical protein
MVRRVAATSIWGNPDEAARSREANQKRQQKEESRPSYLKREAKKAKALYLRIRFKEHRNTAKSRAVKQERLGGE